MRCVLLVHCPNGDDAALPAIPALAATESQRLRARIFAGLTVGLLALPQSVAYASLAGMPLVTGIYATLLPTLVGSLLSGTPRLASGPTALTCLLVFGALSGMAEPTTHEWVILAGWLALLSGVFQIALGALRQGWLMDLVSSPVLMAFTQAAALLIITSQLPSLLAIEWADGRIQSWHIPSAILGAIVLALILLSKQLRPSLPSVFVLLLITAGAAWLFDWDQRGIAIVGPLEGGFPDLAIPLWPGVPNLLALMLPALVIALVSFMETAGSARVDSVQSGKRWDRDQDLIGQGASKLAAGLCGAFPTSTSFSRSALNLFAGAQTGWSNVFCCLVVAVVLMFGLPVLCPGYPRCIGRSGSRISIGLDQDSALAGSMAGFPKGSVRCRTDVSRHLCCRAVDVLGRVRWVGPVTACVCLPAAKSSYCRARPASRP